MTATTSDRDGTRKEGVIIAYPVAASTTILKETLVELNSSGYLEGLTDPSGNFAGISFEGVDNSSGDAGDVYCKVYKEGIFELNLSSAAITDVGEAVYPVDNQTVTKTSTGAVKCGEAVQYSSSGKMFVDISRRT